MNIDEAAHALGGGVKTLKGRRVRCPAHSDTHPSLDLSVGDKVALIWKCQAGCTQEAVGAKLKELGILTAPRRVIKSTPYEIKDINGAYVATHTRLDYDDGTKDVVWSIDGKKGLNGLKKKDLPLYGSETLSALPAGSRVCVHEGEKATAAMIARKKYPAVGTVTGAGRNKQGDELIPDDKVLEVLKPLDPYLWPDNDDGGRRHMAAIAARLHAMGRTVHIIDWKGAPPNGDAADFKGNDDELTALLEAAVVWTPPAPRTQGKRRDTGSFYLTDTAVMKRMTGKDKDGNDKSDEFVCSRLEIVSATRDAHGDEWGRMALWKDDDDRQHAWSIPMRLLAGNSGRNELREHLLAKGLHINPYDHGELAAYLQSGIPSARARSIARLGWHDLAFVYPDENFEEPER